MSSISAPRPPRLLTEAAFEALKAAREARGGLLTVRLPAGSLVFRGEETPHAVPGRGRFFSSRDVAHMYGGRSSAQARPGGAPRRARCP